MFNRTSSEAFVVQFHMLSRDCVAARKHKQHFEITILDDLCKLS